MDVDPTYKKYIAIALWILSILYALANPIFAVFTAIISWYLFAPYLAKYADRHNRNPTWAFALGAICGIFGIFIYWIYVAVTRR